MDLIIRSPQGTQKSLIIYRIIEENLGLLKLDYTERFIGLNFNEKAKESIKSYVLDRISKNITAFIFEVYDLENAKAWLAELSKLRDTLNRDDIHLFFYSNT